MTRNSIPIDLVNLFSKSPHKTESRQHNVADSKKNYEKKGTWSSWNPGRTLTSLNTLKVEWFAFCAKKIKAIAAQNSHATVYKSCREEDIIQFSSPEQHTAAKMHAQSSAVNHNNIKVQSILLFGKLI